MRHRILLTGDLHLGRSSTRMPESLSTEARAASAWSRIVNLALEQRVAAVLLSGDVVDESNRFWEAIGPLEAGIKRLAEAGIRVLAVAGNHDHAVLARLADQLPHEQFVLLGRGGNWERFTLRDNGQAWLNIDGWSFPQTNVYASPLNDYALPVDSDVPTIGFVHGDLGVPNSRYAPLDLGRLQALAPQRWLLGHIHAPQLMAPADRSWVLMPGSPQALDPGETGPHGPWIAKVEGVQINHPEQYPLSAVWYAELTLDLGSANDELALDSLILDGLRESGEAILQRGGDSLAHICLRLRLTGATPVAPQVPVAAERLSADLALHAGRASVAVDKVYVETTRPLNLENLAQGNSIPSALARLLLDLESSEPGPDTIALLKKMRQVLDRAGNAREFTALGRFTLTDEQVCDILRLRARTLLTRLAEGTP